MNKVNININKCKGCGLCVFACPKKVLKLSDELNEHGNPYAVPIDEETCITCCICAMMCPDWAINVNDSRKPKETGKKD